MHVSSCHSVITHPNLARGGGGRFSGYCSGTPSCITYTYERMDFITALALYAYCYTKYCIESQLLRLMKPILAAK